MASEYKLRQKILFTITYPFFAGLRQLEGKSKSFWGDMKEVWIGNKKKK